jgi:hypothetical protein
VVELAVARLHVPPGPCEPRCYGRIAVVPVSLADSVSGLMRPGRLTLMGTAVEGRAGGFEHYPTGLAA